MTLSSHHCSSPLIPRHQRKNLYLSLNMKACSHRFIMLNITCQKTVFFHWMCVQSNQNTSLFLQEIIVITYPGSSPVYCLFLFPLIFTVQPQCHLNFLSHGAAVFLPFLNLCVTAAFDVSNRLYYFLSVADVSFTHNGHIMLHIMLFLFCPICMSHPYLFRALSDCTAPGRVCVNVQYVQLHACLLIQPLYECVLAHKPVYVRMCWLTCQRGRLSVLWATRLNSFVCSVCVCVTGGLVVLTAGGSQVSACGRGGGGV